MRRAVLAIAIASGLAIGAAIPTAAIGEAQITLTCDDGTSTTLLVDADTLTGLTQAVQAMIDYPAGLTCTLVKVPLVTLGTVALAANEPFVVGGGRYQLPCEGNVSGLPGLGTTPGAPTQGAAPNDVFYWVNIAVNVHQKSGDYVGTLNETIPEHQCVAHGHFTSKPERCLLIVALDPVVNRAYVTTRVTQTSQDTEFNFFKGAKVNMDDYVRFSFEDNGNPGQQPPGVDDRLNGRYGGPVDADCANPANTEDPVVDLVHGNITVHP